jgi:hypothetical protein
MIIEEHTHEKNQRNTAWIDDGVFENGRVVVQVIVHDSAPEEYRHAVLSRRRKTSRKSIARVGARR